MSPYPEQKEKAWWGDYTLTLEIVNKNVEVELLVSKSCTDVGKKQRWVW